MARATRNWYVYVGDDHGAQFPSYTFNMLIPDGEAAELSRGWLLATGSDETLNKRMKPRHVIGRNSAGQQGRAICATVTSDLWAGVATSFEVNGVTYVVTGFVGERRTVPAPRA